MAAETKPAARKYGRRYPWKKWFGARHFVLRQGVDYDCRTYVMAVMVRCAACAVRWRRRVSITIHPDERGLTCRVTGRLPPKDEGDSAKAA